jgi:hypothetical protein
MHDYEKLKELRETGHFVVHPLDDLPEQKREMDHLPPMKMTLSVRLSLIGLRVYLILMGFMMLYHVLDLAGVFGHKGP